MQKFPVLACPGADGTRFPSYTSSISDIAFRQCLARSGGGGSDTFIECAGEQCAVR